MSDKELRQILTEVMEDLQSGRLVHWRARKILRRAVVPALLAASLGLASCDTEGVGMPPDSGNWAMYAAPAVDAGADADADADVVPDADWGCPACLYMAPPPVDPEDSD